jgi:hypothetical protein
VVESSENKQTNMILLTLYIPNNAGPIFILALSTCIPWLATPFHPIHKGTSYLLQNEREREEEKQTKQKVLLGNNDR